MRFLVDACVDVAVNRWLQERGDDSIHLRDEQLQRLPEVVQLAGCAGAAAVPAVK